MYSGVFDVQLISNYVKKVVAIETKDSKGNLFWSWQKIH